MDGGLELDSALRRAARNHGIPLQQARSSIASLRAAIRDYRELFRPGQLDKLRQQRRLALTAMQSLAEFQPRLIGSLLHGEGPLDRVRLLLLSESPEQVMLHLTDRHIPWRDTEVTLHYSGGRKLARPAVRFLAGETDVELVIIDSSSRSDPPRDPVTGGPLEMLSADQLSVLIAEGPAG